MPVEIGVTQLSCRTKGTGNAILAPYRAWPNRQLRKPHQEQSKG